MMYVFEYILYHLKPYGLSTNIVLSSAIQRIEKGHGRSAVATNIQPSGTSGVTSAARLKDLYVREQSAG